VLCVDVDSARATETAEKLGVDSMVGDVTNPEDMLHIFSRARKLFGKDFRGFVDIVGMADLRPIANYTPEDWRRQFSIVLDHAFLAVKYGAEVLTEGGSMIFISSLAGIRSIKNQGVYGIAKAALNYLVYVASHEYGPANIRVNAIAPGLTRTPRVVAGFGEALIQDIVDHTPLGRANEPEDIAKAILFFASDMARCITGVVMPIDGGLQHVGSLPTINVGNRLIPGQLQGN